MLTENLASWVLDELGPRQLDFLTHRSSSEAGQLMWISFDSMTVAWTRSICQPFIAQQTQFGFGALPFWSEMKGVDESVGRDQTIRQQSVSLEEQRCQWAAILLQKNAISGSNIVLIAVYVHHNLVDIVFVVLYLYLWVVSQDKYERHSSKICLPSGVALNIK